MDEVQYLSERLESQIGNRSGGVIFLPGTHSVLDILTAI